MKEEKEIYILSAAIWEVVNKFIEFKYEKSLLNKNYLVISNMLVTKILAMDYDDENKIITFQLPSHPSNKIFKSYVRDIASSISFTPNELILNGLLNLKKSNRLYSLNDKKIPNSMKIQATEIMEANAHKFI